MSTGRSLDRYVNYAYLPVCYWSNKLCHDTRESANGHLASLVRENASPFPLRLRVYRCWRCMSYHVGHSHKGAEPVGNPGGRGREVASGE